MGYVLCTADKQYLRVDRPFQCRIPVFPLLTTTSGMALLEPAAPRRDSTGPTLLTTGAIRWSRPIWTTSLILLPHARATAAFPGSNGVKLALGRRSTIPLIPRANCRAKNPSSQSGEPANSNICRARVVTRFLTCRRSSMRVGLRFRGYWAGQYRKPCTAFGGRSWCWRPV